MSRTDDVPELEEQAFVRGPWIWAVLPALAVFALIAAAQLSIGALHVVEYTGDNAYIMDVTARIALGQVPHVDFGLHLGALPFVLMAVVDSLLPGQAFLVAQSLFVAAHLVVAVWIVRTRLPLISGGLLMLAIVLHGMAITGPAAPEVSMVVFYNRWAWVTAYLLLVAMLLDPQGGGRGWFDAGVIGGLAFVLFATKITFFVALIPIGLIRYISLGRLGEVGAAGIVFAALLCAGLLADPMIWVGYVRDLLWVADNPIRPAPGFGFVEMLTVPGLVPYSLAYVSCLALVWISLGARMALFFALAAVALAFVQYQNHGNMPFWVLALAVFAWAVPNRFGVSGAVRILWVVMALLLTGLGARLLYPMTLGTVVNRIAATTDNYRPFLGGTVAMDGIRFTNANFAAETVSILSDEVPIPPLADATECDHGALWVGHFLAQAEIIKGLPGPVFVTDAMTPHWMAAGQAPLVGAAPWNYGSLRGLENAEFVLVPTCAIKMNYKREILRALVREDVPLQLHLRTEDATVYRVGPVP